MGEHVDRLDVASQTARDLIGVPEPRGVQHIGSSALVGLQPRDRVVEVGVAPDVVLRSPGEREREARRRAASTAAATRSAACSSP